MKEAAGAAAAAASCGVEAGKGLPVVEVCEAELRQPAPDEVLVMVQVNPNYTHALADADAAARELRQLTAALRAAATAAGLPLTTVRVQLHTGVSNAAPFDAPLVEVPGEAAPGEAAGTAEAVAAAAGPGFIHDALCELKFRISPTAFFQVNSPATCVLYKLVGDWAAARPKTLLLDICCGTGTIGLMLASKVAKVVGVDNVESAVEDARVNAALNGIGNAEFVAGKAEDALQSILDLHAANDAYEDVVAVCDPPRAGLHKSVLRALLDCAKIRRLVFVSCNPDNLISNVALLCVPPQDVDGGRGRRGGDTAGSSGASYRSQYGAGGGGAKPDYFANGSWVPFRPVKATALDLFPHTAHVETVMLLER